MKTQMIPNPSLIIPISKAVHSNGKENIQQDVIAKDEEDDKVQAGHEAKLFGSSIGYDTIIHDWVPVLASQDLKAGEQTGRQVMFGLQLFSRYFLIWYSIFISW